MHSFLSLIKAASQLGQPQSQAQPNPFLSPALQFASLLSNPLIANCLNAAQIPLNDTPFSDTNNTSDNNNSNNNLNDESDQRWVIW
jgi:hypothetical protein